jgi:hypothetical protein
VGALAGGQAAAMTLHRWQAFQTARRRPPGPHRVADVWSGDDRTTRHDHYCTSDLGPAYRPLARIDRRVYGAAAYRRHSPGTPLRT